MNLSLSMAACAVGYNLMVSWISALHPLLGQARYILGRPEIF